MSKTLLVALALSTLAACAEEAKPAEAPASSGAASTTAAVEKSTTTAAPASYAITAQNSKVEWTGSKTSAHHDGSFTSFTGQVDFAGGVEQSKVSIDIDTSSLTVADPSLGPMVEKLIGHLKSPDFFDIAKFPKATFVSTSIKAGGGAAYTVAGTLTLHGVSKPVTFPANITVAGDKVNADATFPINRKDYGLSFPGKPEDPIKDDVLIKLTIHADKKS
jgi:polyisoprenoid-binding protein YceI